MGVRQNRLLTDELVGQSVHRRIAEVTSQPMNMKIYDNNSLYYGILIFNLRTI